MKQRLWFIAVFIAALVLTNCNNTTDFRDKQHFPQKKQQTKPNSSVKSKSPTSEKGGSGSSTPGDSVRPESPSSPPVQKKENGGGTSDEPSNQHVQPSLESKLAGAYRYGSVRYVFNADGTGEKCTESTNEAPQTVSFTWNITTQNSKNEHRYYGMLNTPASGYGITFDTSGAYCTVEIAAEYGIIYSQGADTHPGEIIMPPPEAQTPLIDSMQTEDHTAIPRLVIVSREEFETSLRPYIKHKRIQGYEVEVLWISSSENNEAIRSRLKNEYESHRDKPMSVLLVGSKNYLPDFEGKIIGSNWGNPHSTDFYYGEYTGSDDWVQEASVGRFSASTTKELDAQIEKTIKMENGLNGMLNRSFTNEILLVRSIPNSDAQDARMHKARIEKISEYMQKTVTGYNVYDYESKDAGSINSKINGGVGLISYTGHGGITDWGSYNNTHVSSLSNDVYPVVLGITCNSGNYSSNAACLAETFLRKENGGAVAYIGASARSLATFNKILICGDDSSGTYGFIPGILGSLYHSTSVSNERYKVRTMGGVFMSGLRVVRLFIRRYGDQARYSLEVYNLFGDPTYMPYTDTPKEISFACAEHTSANAQFTVETNAPYAQVALTQEENGKIILLSSGFADAAGKITLTVPSGAKVGKALLYARAQNYPGKSREITIQ